MSGKPSLRAVQADEAPQKAPRTHRELLVAMRERIEQAVFDPSCPPRDLASLTRRLSDIVKDIDSIDQRAKQEAAEDVGLGDAAWDEKAI